MRIAFITLFKEGFGGGEGRLAHEMARQFSLQHDVALICPGDETKASNRDGLQVLTIKSAGEGAIQVALTTTKQVSRMFDFLDRFRPEIVHTHEPASLCLLGQVWAKMHATPFVHTAHVLPSRIFQFGGVEALKVLESPVSETLTRQTFVNFYQNCDAIIALNQFAARDIREFAAYDAIFSIPNGRDLSMYGQRANTELACGKKTLTFVGYLSERKNQLYLLEVLTHLPPNYRLQLIGEPLKQAYEQQLRDFAQEHALDVTFTGEVTHDKIPSYLAKTHVFVSASKLEVQSLVIIEALASGTPVVGLSNETIDELVDDGVGFRLPKDIGAEEFARHIVKICDLPQSQYEELCANARERVRAHDWSNVIAQTVAIYQTLRENAHPMSEKTRMNLTKALSLIPPGEVKDFVAKQIASLEEALQRTTRTGKSTFASRIRRAKRVHGSTWFFLALTIPLSWIAYQIARYVTSRRQSQETGDGS